MTVHILLAYRVQTIELLIVIVQCYKLTMLLPPSGRGSPLTCRDFLTMRYINSLLLTYLLTYLHSAYISLPAVTTNANEPQDLRGYWT